MKTKLFLTVCSLCLFSGIAAAQFQGKVYLKDGSVIQGTVTRQPNGSAAVSSPGGRFYIFRADEISGILQAPQTKEKQRQPKEKQQQTGKRSFDEIRNAIEAEFGVGYGNRIGSNGNSWLNLSFLAYNYRFGAHFSAGGRIDFDENFTTDRWLVPLLLNFKGYLGPADRSQLFLSLDGGYSAGLTKEEGETAYGGWTVTPAAGIAVRLGNHSALHLSIGYRLQWLPEYIYIGGYSKSPFRSGAVMVRMAIAVYSPR